MLRFCDGCTGSGCANGRSHEQDAYGGQHRHRMSVADRALGSDRCGAYEARRSVGRAAERVLSRLSPAKGKHRAGGAPELKMQMGQRRYSHRDGGVLLAAGRRHRKQRRHWARQLCVPSARLAARSQRSRSASIWGSSSECRCGPIISAGHCSAIASAAGSMRATGGGLWCRYENADLAVIG
jgi:hypothetical protein